MNPLFRISALTALLAAVVPAATAATANDNAPTAQALREPRQIQRRPAIRRQVVRRLGLSAEQRIALKAARASAAAAVRAIRTDLSLTLEQRRARIRATAQATRAELRAILTPDQLSKMNRLRHNGYRARQR